jgi:hypothetical protein
VTDNESEVLWRSGEHEGVTTRPWDEALARRAIEGIVTDAQEAERDGFWPGHPQDDLVEDEQLCSLYLGSAGMVWALWKLGSSLDVSSALQAAMGRYRASPDFGSQAHQPSLWMGETGLLVVAHAVGSQLADPDRLARLVHQNREHPTWELMWGSPGTALAARVCGLRDAWVETAQILEARWDEGDLWTQHLYGDVKQYLGPPHGFAGNVHALRGHVPDDVLARRVTRLLRRTAITDGELVNWPPTLDASGSNIRVQWCHGAPGIVSTLGDLIPQTLAVAGGELIWRAGPLRKGPGLCHGTAGNGFAFLKLHELTGERRWLDRARCFAMHAAQQVERQLAELGRGRYSLWTGDIGVALYLKACLEPHARFPTIDEF